VPETQRYKELSRPAITTGIGSLPHTDAEAAVDFVFSSGLDILFWPQLPQRDWRELMIPQYAEGLPGAIWDSEKNAIRVNTDGDFTDRLAGFFEKTLAGDTDFFEPSEIVAAGYHAFLKRLETEGKRREILKGHITGPITFTLGISSLEPRPIFYLDDLREAAIHLLTAKAVTQVKSLGKHCGRVLIFLDEPALEGYGKAGYEGLSREAVINALSSVIKPIKEAGAIVGIHVCGNTDWGMVAESGPDIINFDAYGYGDKISLYPAEIDKFLADGGLLAWGIVPTTYTVNDDAVISRERLIAYFKQLSDRLENERAGNPDSPYLLTPSCGLGSRSVEDAEKVFRVLAEMREKPFQEIL
jgi:methionine synthase II (cobalamin-independent)